jgi:hypothetical protein
MLIPAGSWLGVAGVSGQLLPTRKANKNRDNSDSRVTNEMDSLGQQINIMTLNARGIYHSVRDIKEYLFCIKM